MKKDKIKIYIFEFLLLIILFFTLLIPYNITRMALAIIITIYMIIISLMLRKRTILSIYHKQVIYLMLGFSIIYLIVFYLMGIYFGFYRPVITFNMKTLFTYIIPITFIVTSSEIIRNILLSQNVKISKILTFISMVLIDLIIYANIYDISSLSGFLTIVGFILFASIGCNLLYNYISIRFGAKPIIIYRLITILYVYIIPIIPDVYVFFRSFLRMLYPYIIYLILEYTYAKNNFATAYKDKKKNIFSTTIIIIIMAIVIMLISCQFKYGILVIGSGSMTGAINKGDAVFFEKYENQEITIGDILIFEKSNINIVHRVIEIKKINGEYRYYTKGDANMNKDEGYILSNQIIGVSKFKIAYIGYPSLWVRELFTR